MEASTHVGDAGESARVSQESGALSFTGLRGLRVVFAGRMTPRPKVKQGAARAAMSEAHAAERLEYERLRQRVLDAGGILEPINEREPHILVAGSFWGPRMVAARERVTWAGLSTRVISPDQLRVLLGAIGA